MRIEMAFIQELWGLYLLLACLAAWIAFAKHSTAQSLRLAIAATLGL